MKTYAAWFEFKQTYILHRLKLQKSYITVLYTEEFGKGDPLCSYKVHEVNTELNSNATCLPPISMHVLLAGLKG